jgi:hypothetical protein
MKKRPGPKPQAPKLNGLTPQQREFVKAYIDKRKSTYLNMTRSAKVAYRCSSEASYQAIGSKTVRQRKVHMALKQALRNDQEDIDAQIKRGIKARLKNPQSKNWQPTADFYAKIQGDFAPEKHVNVNVDPEAFGERLDYIGEKLGKLEAPKDD